MRKRNPAAARQLRTRTDWLVGANPEQAAVIMHDKGPARVMAFAGSGKTRSLVYRIGRLIEDGADPSRILAITFTKKGADEMAARVEKLGVSGARIGTWHSLCIEILRTDRTRWATWETRTETKMELKEVTGWKGMNWQGADVNLLGNFIGRCKAHLYAPGDAGAEEIAKGLFPSHEVTKALQAYHSYQERLEEKEILTFDDYIVNAAAHLADEDNRAQWASRYDYVIQDEAQDESRAQMVLAEMLSRDHQNYMKIGDCFQSIFGWRGSSPEYLANFDRDWPGSTTYVLPRNYRSGRSIIDAANGIVAKASIPGIAPAEMIGERDIDGDVSVRAHEDFDDEGGSFASWVRDSVDAGDYRYQDHCALVRTNAQTRALEEALIAARIPYVVVGGISFYERKEVRDLLAYLRLAARRGAFDDVRRCINAPFRFLGAKFVEKVTAAHDAAIDGAEQVDWFAVARRACEGAGIQQRQRASVEEWAGLVANAAKAIAASESPEARPSVVLEEIIRRTRYIDWIRKEEGEESIETSGAANVREMVRVAERFASVGALLDYVDETLRASKAQREDKQAGGDRVLLMNHYRAKGLEWPRVWLAGFNEMLMPHPKGDPEEERRVAYVAATRARDEMVFSYVRTMATRAGVRDAAPSRFLADAGLGDRDDVDDELADAIG